MNIWQWQDKTHVIASLPSGAQIRLTIGACSGYENGIYSALMQESRVHIKETYDDSPPKENATSDELHKALTAFVSKWIADATPEQLQEWSRYHQRAIMLSTLLSVDTRENKDDEWKRDELPDEWRSIATFSRTIPAMLYDEWLTAAVDLNPGQFIDLPSDKGKKNVKVTSSKLLN